MNQMKLTRNYSMINNQIFHGKRMFIVNCVSLLVPLRSLSHTKE